MIILVGGAPGVGKSAMAFELARNLGVYRLIDLDILRDMIRLQSREKDDPILFRNALNAWELHGPFSQKTVVDGFYAHTRQQVAVTFRMVDSYLSTGKSAIFHGAALLPSQMARYQKRTDVHAFVVASRDEAAYRASFVETHRMRTGRDPAEIRVEAGWILHQSILKAAKECGMAIVAEDGVKKAVEAMMGRIAS